VPRAALAALIVIAAACAHGGGVATRTADLTAAGAAFHLQYDPADADAAERLEALLPDVAARVQRWGVLARPITIVIHPSHAALEEAVGRDGYEWLRAWAQFDRIDLQSPRTWRLLGARDREVRELLTHELTHCAMYQLAGKGTDWSVKGIPRWFSEGLASVSAGQGYRRLAIAELTTYYEASLPGSGDGFAGASARAARAIPFGVGDPLVDPDPIYREQSEVVYAAAHHAMEFLLARYGEERTMRVLKLMSRGSDHRFPEAFREAIGITDAEFASDFRRYVVWQGWRRD
jgi:hypothetical protein